MLKNVGKLLLFVFAFQLLTLIIVNTFNLTYRVATYVALLVTIFSLLAFVVWFMFKIMRRKVQVSKAMINASRVLGNQNEVVSQLSEMVNNMENHEAKAEALTALKELNN